MDEYHKNELHELKIYLMDHRGKNPYVDQAINFQIRYLEDEEN